MVDRPKRSLTLRETLILAERQTRELMEHLELNLLPKVQSLAKLTEPVSADQPGKSNVRDITLRTQVAQILASDEFTARLHEQLQGGLNEIDRQVSEIILSAS